MNPITYLVNLLKRERPSSDRVWQGRQQAGVTVDEDRALTHAAVWGCVRIISETIAALPWRAHQRIGRGNELMDGSPLDYILHVQANPEMSAFSFRESRIAHALLWGNGYGEIERTNRGEAWNIWPVAPDKMHIDRTADGRLWGVVNGQPVLAYDDVFHLHGLGFDGLTGYSVVQHAAKTIGLGIALDSMAANTFQNGGFPGLVITQKEGGKALSPDGIKNLTESFERRFKGPNNAGKVGFLDASMEAKFLEQPLGDLQFLESRKFQVSEIARWFRVPPHKLADLERATFSNIEHQALEFVTDTLVPWITRLETEAQIKLIGRYNRMGRVYTKINVGGLLRGDMASRFAAYAVGRQWGFLSANDIREKEDMNPVAGGDEYFAPMNMVPADMLREINKPKPEPEPLAEPVQPTMRAVK
jgi:HK97 family phage portal protein